MTNTEYGLRSPVLPDAFKSVLISESLHDALAQGLWQTNTKVVPVSSKEELVWNFAMRTLRVPDYETEIRRLVAKERKSLFIHGVRLPTPEDLFTIKED